MVRCLPFILYTVSTPSISSKYQCSNCVVVHGVEVIMYCCPQVQAADLVVVNKCDLAPLGTVADVEDKVYTLAPTAKVMRARFGQVTGFQAQPWRVLHSAVTAAACMMFWVASTAHAMFMTCTVNVKPTPGYKYQQHVAMSTC